jgi:hypothetical protein
VHPVRRRSAEFPLLLNSARELTTPRMTTLVLPNLARRAGALAFVFAAHLVTLFLLATFTRSRAMSAAEDRPPLVRILMLSAQTQPNTETHAGLQSRAPHSRRSEASSIPPLAQPPDDEAKSTAIREVEREAQERRRADALALPNSALIGRNPRPRPPSTGIAPARIGSNP